MKIYRSLSTPLLVLCLLAAGCVGDRRVDPLTGIKWFNIATVDTDQKTLDEVGQILKKENILFGYHGSVAYAVIVPENKIEEAVRALRNNYRGNIEFWNPPKPCTN